MNIDEIFESICAKNESFGKFANVTTEEKLSIIYGFYHYENGDETSADDLLIGINANKKDLFDFDLIHEDISSDGNAVDFVISIGKQFFLNDFTSNVTGFSKMLKENVGLIVLNEKSAFSSSRELYNYLNLKEKDPNNLQFYITILVNIYIDSETKNQIQN